MGPHLMLLRYFTIAMSHKFVNLSNNKVIVMHGEFGALFFFSKRKESVG